MSSLTLTGNVVYFGAQLAACLVVGGLAVSMRVPWPVRLVLIVVAVVVVSRVMITSGVLDRWRVSGRR